MIDQVKRKQQLEERFQILIQDKKTILEMKTRSMYRSPDTQQSFRALYNDICYAITDVQTEYYNAGFDKVTETKDKL